MILVSPFYENKKLGEKSLENFKNKTKINYPDADDIKASFIPEESIVNNEIDNSRDDNNNISINIQNKTRGKKDERFTLKTSKTGIEKRI